MKAKVFCLTTAKGVQSFYLEAHGERHYLFSQNFRRSVKDYFGRGGVHMDAALDFSRSGHSTSVIHTMRKLPSYIRYIEKEYGIEVLRQTARRNASLRRRTA